MNIVCVTTLQLMSHHKINRYIKQVISMAFFSPVTIQKGFQCSFCVMLIQILGILNMFESKLTLISVIFIKITTAFSEMLFSDLCFEDLLC